MATTTQQRKRRHKRIRAKLSGTAAVPRLAVYKSNRFMHVQLIDDEAQRTIASVFSRGSGGTKTEQARTAGEAIAAQAQKAGVERVRFDRGGFIYSGRIRAVADAAREKGLQL